MQTYEYHSWVYLIHGALESFAVEAAAVMEKVVAMEEERAAWMVSTAVGVLVEKLRIEYKS